LKELSKKEMIPQTSVNYIKLINKIDRQNMTNILILFFNYMIDIKKFDINGKIDENLK